MKVFDRVFSPAAMLKLQPTIELAITKRVARWHECAASGEVIAGIRGGVGMQAIWPYILVIRLTTLKYRSDKVNFRRTRHVHFEEGDCP